MIVPFTVTLGTSNTPQALLSTAASNANSDLHTFTATSPNNLSNLGLGGLSTTAAIQIKRIRVQANTAIGLIFGPYNGTTQYELFRVYETETQYAVADVDFSPRAQPTTTITDGLIIPQGNGYQLAVSAVAAPSGNVVVSGFVDIDAVVPNTSGGGNGGLPT